MLGLSPLPAKTPLKATITRTFEAEGSLKTIPPDNYLKPYLIAALKAAGCPFAIHTPMGFGRAKWDEGVAAVAGAAAAAAAAGGAIAR